MAGGFSDSLIFSNETGKIQVDCNSNTAIDGNECSGLQIFGEDAQYVELNCKNNTNCEELDIYCPVDSSFNTEKSNPYSCVLTSDDAQIVAGNIYVVSSSWNTYLNIPTFTCDNCDITIYCNYMENFTQDSCTMTQSGITNLCNASQGLGCLDATNFPSFEPTIHPTPPTSHPTHFPSTTPTHAPSDIPSSIPSQSPSTSPSSFPSMSPSTSPTLVPTTYLLDSMFANEHFSRVVLSFNSLFFFFLFFPLKNKTKQHIAVHICFLFLRSIYHWSLLVS